MTVKTYLKNHESVQRFYLQSKQEVSVCERDNFDDMNIFGNMRIKGIEEPPSDDELVTLIV